MAKDKEEVIVDVEQVYSNTEKWVLENQKSLSIIFGAIILLFGSYFSFKNFVVAPQEEEAGEYIWQAQNAFAKDSFNLAINGNESSVGFLYIIDNYSMTEAANLSHYYTGISYLHLGEYDLAIEHLDKFDCNDVMVCSVALGATGDAYMQLGDTERAIDYFESAAEHRENELTSPIYLMKAAQAYETLGDYESALKLYKEIEREYPESEEGQTIEKYITRAEGMAGA